MTARIAPYGDWQGLLDAETLFNKAPSPQYPCWYEGRYYWLESRALEGGRSVIVERQREGQERTVTPDGYSVRTRVHEYGGKCFILGNGCVYFSNDSDQVVYSQRLDQGSLPVAISVATDRTCSFSDLCLSPSGTYLIGVMEQSVENAENANCLFSLALDDVCQQPQRIVHGADFYANPVIDVTGSRIAWIQWSHPDMPWDSTKLMMANVVEDESGLRLEEARTLVDGDSTAVCQLGFYGRDLIFAMDCDADEDPAGDYWNLYAYRDGNIVRLTCDSKEYGAPHWVFGERNHASPDGNSVYARRIDEAGDEIVRIDRVTGEQQVLDMEFTSFMYLSEGEDELLFIASSSTELPQLIGFDSHGDRTIKRYESVLSDAEVSVGTPIRFPTRDGQFAYGYYYVPHNPDFEAPATSLPPLLVMVHGGPTARAGNSLDFSRQYWTGMGFAVLDVNHRGSTGHGRRYRQHLLGRWGQVDIDDVIDGIDYLVNQSLVDPGKILIRGKSAGGYTVMRALTEYPDKFCGGACYYGIGNLATLASHTHKFEARYTDRLIGETYDPVFAVAPESEYYKRSPIFFVNEIASPVILFQGLDDTVVPPAVSREVVATLSAANVEHEYVEYPGEGHGFRSSKTNIDAIQRETRFYRRVLGLV